ncbi:unnamed protein product [Ectocarpus sp. CCAP 1310/34]|nr:unnamed protein product [Ectocarpus sp. CCAP 1310/34]
MNTPEDEPDRPEQRIQITKRSGRRVRPPSRYEPDPDQIMEDDYSDATSEADSAMGDEWGYREEVQHDEEDVVQREEEYEEHDTGQSDFSLSDSPDSSYESTRSRSTDEDDDDDDDDDDDFEEDIAGDYDDFLAQTDEEEGWAFYRGRSNVERPGGQNQKFADLEVLESFDIYKDLLELHSARECDEEAFCDACRHIQSVIYLYNRFLVDKTRTVSIMKSHKITNYSIMATKSMNALLISCRAKNYPQSSDVEKSMMHIHLTFEDIINGAFNSMLSEFFCDLADTFDEYTVITDAKTMLEGLMAADECTEIPMGTFVEVFKPHADLIMTKDPKLFDVCEILLITGGEFDMAKEWTALEDDNREAIWNYIQQLFPAGTTILSMSGKVLSSIQSLAQGCMKKVENGELTESQAQDPMAETIETLKCNNSDSFDMAWMFQGVFYNDCRHSSRSDYFKCLFLNDMRKGTEKFEGVKANKVSDPISKRHIFDMMRVFCYTGIVQVDKGEPILKTMERYSAFHYYSLRGGMDVIRQLVMDVINPSNAIQALEYAMNSVVCSGEDGSDRGLLSDISDYIAIYALVVFKHKSFYALGFESIPGISQICARDDLNIREIDLLQCVFKLCEKRIHADKDGHGLRSAWELILHITSRNPGHLSGASCASPA